MKLMVFIFALSLSQSSFGFVKGGDLTKRITIYEKVRTNNSGIVLKTEQQQAERIPTSDEEKIPGAQPGNWQLLKKNRNR